MVITKQMNFGLAFSFFMSYKSFGLMS